MTIKELAERYAEKPTAARYEVLRDAIFDSDKWICVDDDVPTEQGEYFITWETNYDKRKPHRFIEIAEFVLENGWDIEHIKAKGNVYADAEVIAWMELPSAFGL